jgi:DNA helicase-2/ATP-dependent DNA helicase PcrA
LEALAAWAACGRESTGYKLGDLLDQWQQLGDRAALRASAHEVVAVLLSSMPETSASTFVEAMVGVIGDAGVLEGLWSDDANELERMREALGPSGSLGAYSVHDLGRLRLRDGRVEVSTMSASKGLEFDHVFIAALEEGKLPFYSSTRGTPEWAEDRRKFYVSFTRARDTVEVLYSGWYPTSWGVRRNGPSVFLRESGLVR